MVSSGSFLSSSSSWVLLEFVEVDCLDVEEVGVRCLGAGRASTSMICLGGSSGSSRCGCVVGFVEVLAPIAGLLGPGRSFARGAVRVESLVDAWEWFWSGSGRRRLIGLRLTSGSVRLGGDGGLC